MTVSGYYGRVKPLLTDRPYSHVFEKYRGATAYFPEPVHGLPTDWIRYEATHQLLKAFGISTTNVTFSANVAFFRGGKDTGRNSDAGERSIFAQGLPKWLPSVALPRSYAGRDASGVWEIYARDVESIVHSEPRARLAPEILLCYQNDKDWGSPSESEGWFLDAKDLPNWARLDVKVLGDPDYDYRTAAEIMQAAATYSTIVTTNVDFAILGLLMARTVVVLDKGMNRGVYETWLQNVGECHWDKMPY